MNVADKKGTTARTLDEGFSVIAQFTLPRIFHLGKHFTDE